MKASILLLPGFLLNFSFIFGQISLESSYDGSVERVILEFSGEKYYYLDTENKQVKLYHSDHSPWKTVDLPSPEESAIWFVDHVSEGKINSDTKLEIIYSFYIENGDDKYYEERIINDEGTILLSIPNGYYVELSELPGAENKLIASIKGALSSYSVIYTVPALTPEHSYELELGRWNFENSGEKYVALDLSNKQFIAYNADHSLWKTIGIPDTTGLRVYQWNVSETKINSDNQLEILYAYYTSISPGRRYVGVINESGTPVLTIPDAFQFTLEELPGKSNKILAYFSAGSHLSTRVYDLPGLAEEMYYEYSTRRAALEISGEIYYHTDVELKEVKLYDGDHHLWRTIELDVPSNATVGSLQHISEHKIIKDDKIEFLFTFYITENEIKTYESRVMNEDGTNLLVLPDVSIVKLIELPGADPKLVAYYRQSDNSYTTEVYGMPASSTEAKGIYKFESEISVFPNPTSGLLEIELADHLIGFARIFTLNGQLLQIVEPGSGKTVLDLSALNAGVYLLEVQDIDGNTFKEKVVVK
ncbi:MAG: T9SS type A sorting domain-containing protein [Bacteroidales bacterium]